MVLYIEDWHRERERERERERDSHMYKDNERDIIYTL